MWHSPEPSSSTSGAIDILPGPSMPSSRWWAPANVSLPACWTHVAAGTGLIHLFCLAASASNRLHPGQPLHIYIHRFTKGVHLTMAFRLAILRVPRARQVVMTAGRPSGMAATASATAILK